MTAPATPGGRLRNIGVIAHIDAGKTTTTERILYHTGRTHSLGSVDDGTTVTDWMAQERERGITIVAAAVTACWRDHQINLIDTPGHIDFTAEVQRALRVLDGAIVVFDAQQGVEPQSETVWRYADHYRVPRLCFINKMDRTGADFAHALGSIRERLGANPVALQLPLGAEAAFEGVVDLVGMDLLRWQDNADAAAVPAAMAAGLAANATAARASLVEAVAEHDDTLLALWLDGTDPPADVLRAAIRRATRAGRIVPVMCGSALRNKGVTALLDAVVDYLPSPLDIGTVEGTAPDTGQSVTCHPTSDSPLAALLFKTVTDPYAGHLAYLRIYSGVLASGARVFNPRQGRSARVGRLVRMYAAHREEIGSAEAGDIIAVLGLKGAISGDTLCDEAHPVLLESISFPEPVVQITLTPHTSEDGERLAQALHDLATDDPTFGTHTDDETGQIIVTGMGELHLEILLDRLRREYGIEVRSGRPRVAYRETITRLVPRAEGRLVKQTGGHGQYGHVVLAVTPVDPVHGILFDSTLTGGVIPQTMLPAIEAGIREAALNGVLGGYQVTGLAVTLIDGSYHAVDSSPLAFKVAAGMALRWALNEGQPILLEPVVRAELLCPSEQLGDVLGQLSARRAEINGVDTRPGELKAIRAQIPLAEMFGYATELRSATHGRGFFTMEFDHYAPALADSAKRSVR